MIDVVMLVKIFLLIAKGHIASAAVKNFHRLRMSLEVIFESLGETEALRADCTSRE